jgi:hypothetical protein
MMVMIGPQLQYSDSRVSILTMEAFYKPLSTVLYMTKMINENLVTFTMGIETYRNNFFYHAQDSVMQRLVQGGIPQWIFRFIDDAYLHPLKHDNLGPKVFSLDGIGHCFIIWLVTCAIAILAFVAELLVFYGWRGLKKIVGIFFFTTNLHRFIRNNAM